MDSIRYLYYDNRTSKNLFQNKTISEIAELIRKTFDFEKVEMEGYFDTTDITNNSIRVVSNQGSKIIITPKSKDVACQLLKFKNNSGTEIQTVSKENNVFSLLPKGVSAGSVNTTYYFDEIGFAMNISNGYQWKDEKTETPLNIFDNTYGLYKIKERSEVAERAAPLGENAYVVQMKDYCFGNKDGYCVSFESQAKKEIEGNFIYQNLGVLYGYTSDPEIRKTNKIWGTGLEPILLYTNNNISNKMDNLNITYDSVNKKLKINNEQEFLIDQGALIILGRRCQNTELEQGLRFIDNVNDFYSKNALNKFKMFSSEDSKVTTVVNQAQHYYYYYKWTPFLWINPGCVSWISLNAGCFSYSLTGLSQMELPTTQDILINSTLTYFGFQTKISDYQNNLPLTLSLNNELPISSKQGSYQTWWTNQKENYKITWNFGQLTNEQYNLSNLTYSYNDKIFSNPTDSSSILGLEDSYDIGQRRFWTVSKFDAYKREETIAYGSGTSSGQCSMKTSEGKIIINFKTYKTCNIDNIVPETPTTINWGLSLAYSLNKYSFIKLVGTINTAANGMFPKKINLVNTPTHVISDSGVNGIGEVDYYKTRNDTKAGGSAFIQNEDKIQNSYWIIWVPYHKWKRVDIELEQVSSYDNMYGYTSLKTIDTTNWKHYYVDFPDNYQVFGCYFNSLYTSGSTFLITIDQNQLRITLSVYYLER